MISGIFLFIELLPSLKPLLYFLKGGITNTQNQMFLTVTCWEFRLLLWHHLVLIQHSLFQVCFAQTLSSAGKVKPPLEMDSCAILGTLFL